MEESAGMTDADWAKLGNDFMQRMGLMNHQYIIVTVSYTHLDVYKRQEYYQQMQEQKEGKE